MRRRHLFALAVFAAAVLCQQCSCSGGGERGREPRIKGLNAVLTNEMSDSLGLEKLDRDMENFRKRWWIKGLSLAVMRGDSLLYAKGYGWADEQKQQKMEPGRIMRVASVSKLITATGIMKLQEMGKLHLSDKVFGESGILNDTLYTNAIRDKGYFDITVEDLLRHESGLSSRRGDPMFTTRDIMNMHKLKEAPDQHQLTSLMLQRRLGFRPGSSHEYSNLGYLLLSMIIEKVTGEPYEKWMQENVLQPAGCLDMHIAHTYYEQKYSNEVRYYMQHNDPKVEEYTNSGDSVIRCYGGSNVRGLSGAGAWVTSPAELALFVASIDGKQYTPDILSPSSVKAMTAWSSDHRYGIGWNSVKPSEGWIRTGSLAGTNAMVYYMPSGECWIMVSNTHNWKGPRFSTTVRRFLAECSRKYSSKLPQRDLFLLD